MLSCSKGVGLEKTEPIVDEPDAQRARPIVAGAATRGASAPVGASLHDAHEKLALLLSGVQVRAVAGTGAWPESKRTAPVAFSTSTAPPLIV